MNDEVARSIRFPKSLWDAIDEDARRCKRSAVKQMESVLAAYYELEDVDLNRQNLQMVGQIMRKGKTTLPLIEATAGEGEKKKRA